ncbi:glycosyltransferase family 2 protein [Luteimonas dalianensis]|uniref:glycosyltransferase family 2 protein n=1 Tax=Luteimonas dalianensis TaxID=1148196 RepID=UPI003BF3F503
MSGIAAVVVTFESASTIGECLDRLRAAEGVVQVRVVDNASSDDTVAIIQRHATADPRVRFIANPDNPGFGSACNQGVAAVDAADAQWVALINPDLMVEPDTLARMTALAREAGAGNQGGVGAPCVLLGADLVGGDGVRDPAARRRAPDFAAMLRALASGGGSTSASMAIPPDDGLALQPVEAVSGALMLMPRALFDRLGGFDEGYRLHAEDLDLCRRAHDSGALVAVANQVRVLHVRGVSSRARPVFVEWHKHRGLARYFRRFEAPRRSLPVRLLVYAMIWARFPFAALRAL